MPKSILRDEDIFESRLNLYDDKYGTDTKYKAFEDENYIKDERSLTFFRKL